MGNGSRNFERCRGGRRKDQPAGPKPDRSRLTATPPPMISRRTRTRPCRQDVRDDKRPERIVPTFGRRLGYGLMFTESRVLMAVLEEFIRRGIVALPLHDGLLCAQSRKEEAVRVKPTHDQ